VRLSGSKATLFAVGSKTYMHAACLDVLSQVVHMKLVYMALYAADNMHAASKLMPEDITPLIWQEIKLSSWHAASLSQKLRGMPRQ
jgi:hypothetical protein